MKSKSKVDTEDARAAIQRVETCLRMTPARDMGGRWMEIFMEEYVQPALKDIEVIHRVLRKAKHE